MFKSLFRFIKIINSIDLIPLVRFLGITVVRIVLDTWQLQGIQKCRSGT